MPETSKLTKVLLLDDVNDVQLTLSSDSNKIDARRQVRMIVDVNKDGTIGLDELMTSMTLVGSDVVPYTSARLGRGQLLRGNFGVLRISVAWTDPGAPPATVTFTARFTQNDVPLSGAPLGDPYELSIPVSVGAPRVGVSADYLIRFA